MAKRIKKEKSDYQKALREYRRHSERHVLVLETRMSRSQKCAVFHIADLERKAGNELVRIMKNRLSQLFRTKRYRKLRRLYGMYRNRKDNENAKLIADEMTGMENKYGVTKEACDAAMIRLYKRYGIYSVFAMTRAESIWGAVKKKIYSDGKELHFSRRGELPSIRAKQIDRGISLYLKDWELRFGFNGEEFGVRDNGKDRFITEEMSAISEHLLHPEESDMYAVRKMQQNGEVIPTYRPCYVSLVCKTIRGRMRVFAHITVEGRAIAKYDRNGNPRHGFGTGPVGCDIGTQTIAYTSDSKVGLENLAERGPSILENERKERILYRAMDRSRRATNKDNYNKDGTIRKGPKKWHFSKRYRKLKAEHSELCRINAENRHLAINEQVNRIRELGNIFVTEKKNAKRLQKRAKETTLNANGRINRKKRFGKSIKNRCPGYFQLQARNKFERTGGAYIEVPDSYRASQYDHIGDVFVKKKLSQRMFPLEDGTVVQRDWYSSFLLYNIDIKEQTIDKNRCRNNFEWQYQRERNMISDIIVKGKKILNSGIRIA